jgi:hypothetical protein
MKLKTKEEATALAMMREHELKMAQEKLAQPNSFNVWEQRTHDTHHICDMYREPLAQSPLE